VGGGRIYWIDRCLGSEIVPAALAAAGIQVRRYVDVYPDDPAVPDAVWIPEIAQRGWIAVTKDNEIRRNPVELAALHRARARHVFLGARKLTGEEQAACLVEHWKTIESVVAHKAAPLLVLVTRQAVQWLDGERWRIAKRKR
jgi:hypothetical protein